MDESTASIKLLVGKQEFFCEWDCGEEYLAARHEHQEDIRIHSLVGEQWYMTDIQNMVQYGIYPF